MRFGLGFGIDVRRGGFDPRSLFASGEQGIWLDPSDFSTLYQDEAGATPVTAVGQPVGRINDKSGRGNHASWSTDASRPTLQQDSNGMYYLSFDGVDDRMQFVTPSASSLSGSNRTVILGIQFVGALPTTTQVYLSRGLADWYVGVSADKKLLTSHRNAAGTQKSVSHGGAINLGVNRVDSFRWLTVGNNVTVTARSNKAIQPPQFTMPLTDGYITSVTGATWQIGAFMPTGTPFPANRLYGLIVRNDYTSDDQIAAAEAWMNSKTRAYV